MNAIYKLRNKFLNVKFDEISQSYQIDDVKLINVVNAIEKLKPDNFFNIAAQNYSELTGANLDTSKYIISLDLLSSAIKRKYLRKIFKSYYSNIDINQELYNPEQMSDYILNQHQLIVSRHLNINNVDINLTIDQNELNKSIMSSLNDIKKQAIKFIEETKDSLHIVYTDLIIGDKELKLGGSIPFLFFNQDLSKIQIYYFTSSTDLIELPGSEITIQLNDTYSFNFSDLNILSAILNIYEHIIQKNLNIELAQSCIINIHENLDYPEQLQIRDLSKEFINYYQNIYSSM